MTQSPSPSVPPTAFSDLDGTTDPDNISRPYYGASFGVAVKRYFKQYANFTGRASRSEYWFAQLFAFIVMLIPNLLFTIGLFASAAWASQNPVVTNLGYDSTGAEVNYEGSPGLIHAPTGALFVIGFILVIIVGLALLLPQLAIQWRRLHDANLAGPLVFLQLFASAGSLIVLILTLLPSKPEGRRFDTRP